MAFARLEEIRKRRETLGISLKKFSQMIDTKPSFLSMIETRKANPNYNLLEKIFLTLDQQEKHSIKEIKTVGVLSKIFTPVSKNESLSNAVDIMQNHDFSQLPVFSHTTCVGLITEHSITKYLLDNKEKPNVFNTKVEEIMDFPPLIIDSNYKITPNLLEFLSDHNCVLVSENGRPTSILTKIDVIRGMMKK